MKNTRMPRGRVIAVASALAATTALILSGCSTSSAGSTTSSGGGGVPSAVTTQLTQYEAAQKFDFSGSQINVASLKGKTIWWIPQDAGNPFLATVEQNAKTALASVGVKVVQCDGKSNPVDANNCIKQGIAQKVAAIEVDGPAPATISNAAQAAKAAGIPVLVGAGIDASESIPSYIAAISSQPYELTGQLAADWVIKDSNGKGNVLVETTPDVNGSENQAKAFEAQLKKYCPACTYTEKGVTLGNWASQLGPTTSAALSKDPTINYVFPVFDPMTQFTNPAIQQAGKANTVKVVTANGNLPFMKEMATGTSPTKAMVGLDLGSLGYQEADQVLRVLTGSQPVKNDYPPARLFTVDSAKKLTLNNTTFADSSWYAGSGSTSKLFASLWKQ